MSAPVSQEIVDQVNQMMMSGFELSAEQLVPTATLFDDLGLDSLDAVDMLVHIEENMGVKVEGERLASVKILADVYQLAAESMSASRSDQVERSHTAQPQVGQLL